MTGTMLVEEPPCHGRHRGCEARSLVSVGLCVEAVTDVGHRAGQELGVDAVLEGRTECKCVSRALKKIDVENVLDHRCRWERTVIARRTCGCLCAGLGWRGLGRRLAGVPEALQPGFL